MWGFKGSANEFTAGGSIGVSWPIFRSSRGGDDRYFPMLRKDTISVYETETFALVDNKSLEVENAVDFSWSLTDPIVCLFAQELGGANQPARASLVRILSKGELRQKIL